ncbi:unnamed protein product [Discula destructiva]
MSDPEPEADDIQLLAGAANQLDALQCCCGNTDCLLLKHNCSVLDSVEKDVHTAARLGQALLARHEALMASAENERFEMQTRIDQLETDKQSLEVENARTIQENRALLDHLEALNNSVTDSELHIRSLEAKLASSQQVIRNMEGQESRAAELESQLGVLETEQAELQSTLVMSQAEARSAMSRWRQAERGISDLQEELERIEREACEERERHADMVSRMEKQRNVERDLNTAAGRLKGAAAAKTIGDGRTGAVVSQFVRDLLSDNANLQMGIAELREMLVNSNDEMQLLREQLMYHQPAEEDRLQAATTLRAELAPEEQYARTPLSPKTPQRPDPATAVSQGLHIHHHYHVSKLAEPRKPLKKKRHNLALNNLAPPRPYSPAPTVPWRLESRATSPALVAHSANDSISTIPSTRWSVFSEPPSDFALSSVPSSPVSLHRSSICDRDYENPTSPTTSVDPNSPRWTRPQRPQKSADAALRNFTSPRPLCLDDLPENDGHSDHAALTRYQRSPKLTEGRQSITRASHRQTPSLNENLSPDCPSTPASPAAGLRRPGYDNDYDFARRPHLRRATSQESIMSLAGGLDIHTLQGRPSQLAFKTLGAARADTQVTTMIARPTIARGPTNGKRGSVTLRDNLHLLSMHTLRQGTAAAAGSDVQAAQDSQQQQVQQQTGNGLVRFVSLLWAPKDTADRSADNSGTSTPAPSSEGGGTTSRDVSPAPTPGSSIMETPTTDSGGEQVVAPPSLPAPTKLKKPKVPELVLSPPRTFGINQPGVIPGFSEYWAAHQLRGPRAQIVPVEVDTEALREAVEDSY